MKELKLRVMSKGDPSVGIQPVDDPVVIQFPDWVELGEDDIKDLKKRLGVFFETYEIQGIMTQGEYDEMVQIENEAMAEIHEDESKDINDQYGIGEHQL